MQLSTDLMHDIPVIKCFSRRKANQAMVSILEFSNSNCETDCFAIAQYVE